MEQRRKRGTKLSHINDHLYVPHTQWGMSEVRMLCHQKASRDKLRTLDGSVLISFLPPAILVLIVLINVSPLPARRSSHMGMSID